MIKRDTYKEITSGGSGSGASQTEIYEIFEGTNPQGRADSIFETLSGNNTPLANTQIEDKSGSYETSANLLFFLNQFLSPNSLNGSTIADQLSETISGSDTTISNLLIETLSGNTKSIANVCFDSYQELSSVNSNLQNIDTNTNQTSNYLSSIRTPVIISTSSNATISGQLHNISFYNSGSNAGTITVNGTTVNLPAGVTVNYDAGGNNNRFATNIFSYNATGTTFIISYVS